MVLEKPQDLKMGRQRLSRWSEHLPTSLTPGLGKKIEVTALAILVAWSYSRPARPVPKAGKGSDSGI
jgi:hypothetical protein